MNCKVKNQERITTSVFWNSLIGTSGVICFQNVVDVVVVVVIGPLAKVSLRYADFSVL